MKAIGFTSVLTVSRSQRSRLKLALVFTFVSTLLAGPGFGQSVTGPQSSQTAAVSRISNGNTPADDTRYRIGPGDVLSILVRKAPELSGPARVDQRGMIRIAMIDKDIKAACRTETELAEQIATLYLEYKNNPNVEVFVADFQSRPVAVIGAVDKPGQFRLQRRVRLLELISSAGGPTDKAGRVINVIHAGGPNLCTNEKVESEGASAAQALSVYKLDDTMKGTDESNPFVQAGDVVSLPEADQVFVVGYVYQPKSIPLKDKPITVSRAIEAAGGPQRDASTSNVRIVRQAPDGMNKQAIPVDLKAIQKQKAEDIILLPNDIVEVGTSTSKMLFNVLTGTIPSVVSQGILRIP
jgi:polysaccharide export outer membrane protein